MKNKFRTFLLLSLIFITRISVSQATIFDRITEALILNKDTAKALVHIDSLLILEKQKWTYPVLNYNINIGKIYLSRGDFEKYYKFFLKYEDLYFLQKKKFTDDSLFGLFMASEYYKKLLTLKLSKNGFSDEQGLSMMKEKFTLDNIMKADMFIRNYVRNISNSSMNDSIKNNQVVSSDINNVKEFMKQYKNTSTYESLIEYDTFFMHVFTKCRSKFNFSYNFIDSLLQKQIFNGKYQAMNYAFLVDNSLSVIGGCAQPQKFGTLIADKQIQYPVNNIKKIDVERRKIGLQPLWMDALIRDYHLPGDYPVPEEGKKYFHK